MTADSFTRLIALDWGTSSARAYRIGATGEVLERREAPLGILHVRSGGFGAALLELLGDWAALEVPRIAGGMIGSRQGWVEAPYVDCPADVAALAAGLARTPGGELAIVPGLVCRDRDGVPDVMRGEETQLAGAVGDDESDVVAVLPGTHSKWARIHRGRILEFSTYMTGELYAVLVGHSILGRLASPRVDGLPPAQDAFVAGVRRGLAGSGLSHAVFGARTRALMGELPGDEVGDWLSGVLLGEEIAAARRWLGDEALRAPVRVIGRDALAQRYRVALAEGAIPAVAGPLDAAALGLFRIACIAGWCR